MAAACAEDWEAPPRPPGVEAAVARWGAAPAPEWGAAARSEFMLDGDWTFVNHGAFGAPCRAAYEVAAAWRLHAERQPLRFLDRELFPHLVASLRSLGRILGASPANCVLLPNATHALNVAISSAARDFMTAPGSRMLLLDVGYGSVRATAERACAAVGGSVEVVPVAAGLPASAETGALLAAVAARLAGGGVRVAVFDVVTSNTALALPVADLADLCRRHGVAVVVDGAHGPGSGVEVDVADADYYCGNLHKWYCAPRGCGFLYARDVEAAPEPLVVSHGYGSGFASDFIWRGAGDFSAPLALPALEAWWERVGGVGAAAVRNAALASDAARLLAGAWATEPLVDGGAAGPPMALVRIPGARGGATPNDGKALQDALHYDHKVECPVKTVNGDLYVRVSAALYNDLDDYRALAAAVLATLPGQRT